MSDGNPQFESAMYYSLSAGDRYLFDPENPYGAFDEYSVIVTPESRKVFEINAEAEFHHISGCRSELIAVKQSLEKKYGSWEDSLEGVSFSDSVGIGKTIHVGTGSRYIISYCHDFEGEITLMLSYVDESLEETAEAEKARMRGGNYDGSGL